MKVCHENSVSAILVGDFEADRQLVRELFRKHEWMLVEARDGSRALAYLDRYPFQVAIVEADTPDGNWKRILQDLRDRHHPSQLIVTSRHADDRLWAEALNMGAFDVLSQPFERLELERAVDSAHRHVEVPVASGGRTVAAAGAA